MADRSVWYLVCPRLEINVKFHFGQSDSCVVFMRNYVCDVFGRQFTVLTAVWLLNLSRCSIFHSIYHLLDTKGNKTEITLKEDKEIDETN